NNLESGASMIAPTEGDDAASFADGVVKLSGNRTDGATSRLTPAFCLLLEFSMSRVLVIGAGITGVTTAYTLSRRGFDVTVIDRLPYAAMDTSFANGGQLSASNAEVWNQPGTLFKGIKWMLQK